MALVNVTNNNSMLSILKDKLQMISGSEGNILCDGEHVKCCAYMKKMLDMWKHSHKGKNTFAACRGSKC